MKLLYVYFIQIRDQYVRTVSELSQQNSLLQNELKTARNDLKVANIQVVDLRNTLEDLRNQLLLKVIHCTNSEYLVV